MIRIIYLLVLVLTAGCGGSAFSMDPSSYDGGDGDGGPMQRVTDAAREADATPTVDADANDVSDTTDAASCSCVNVPVDWQLVEEAFPGGACDSAYSGGRSLCTRLDASPVSPAAFTCAPTITPPSCPNGGVCALRSAEVTASASRSQPTARVRQQCSPSVAYGM